MAQECRLTVDPVPEDIRRFRDYYGNEVHHVSIVEPHSILTVEATSLVNLNTGPPLAPSWTQSWESVGQHIRECGDRLALEAFDFTGESPYVTLDPEVAAWSADIFEPGRPVLEAAMELSSRIHKEFTYVPCSTTIDTQVPDVFRMRKGVCQDFAHLMIAGLRSAGLGARYVSGYLRSGADYTGAEASHAWVAVYVPAVGWIDLDPTNNVLPGDGHVTLAWGRDYGDVTPIKGLALGGGDHQVEVSVRVSPITTAETGPVSV